jgi:hypothetical protein
MIQAIISLFGIIRGLFITGGFFTKIFTWFSGSFGWFATAIIWLGTTIKDFFVGTAVAFKRVAVYLVAFHLVEIARRIFFIGLIVSVFGFVIDYAVNNVAVFSGKTITVLTSEFISAINSFGPLGQNLLAFMTKMGFFEALSLLITVMLYTLMVRVALTILFK